MTRRDRRRRALRVEVSRFGSIVLLTALNASSVRWLQAHLDTEAWQWRSPSAVVVEGRTAGPILEALTAAGAVLS